MERNVLDQSVANVMSSPVRTIELDTAVTDAARILQRNRIGALVVEDGGIAGIVTETDLVRAVAAEHDLDRLRIAHLMSEEVVTVDAGAEVATACDLMRTNEIKKLPVTDGEQLVGIVTTTDVAHALVPDLDDVILSYQ
jgi:CBS domain-containing protein